MSGGERTRLAMIRLLLEPVNLLILDEPTTTSTSHRRGAEKAIRELTALNIVSHDRDFLNELVGKVCEFGGGEVGNIWEESDFLSKDSKTSATGTFKISRNKQSEGRNCHL